MSLRRRRRLPRPAAASGAGSAKAAAAIRPARYARIGRRVPATLRRGACDVLAGRRVVFAVCGMLAGLSLARVPQALIAAPLLSGLGWRLAGVADARAERDRAAVIARALPDAIDLLAVCVIGGMGLDSALRRVAAATGGPAGEAMTRAVAALDAGLRWDDALQVFADRAGTADARSLVAALRRAARYGAPLADTLVAQAAEARAVARDRAREHALGAPVRMLFPLTLCFLPAFALLAIAPSLLVAIHALGQR